MPVHVIATGETMPKKGALGDMVFEVSTGKTYVWDHGGGWQIVQVSSPVLNPELLDGDAAIAAQRASDWENADQGSTHGKRLLASVLTDELGAAARARFGRGATATVAYYPAGERPRDGSHYEMAQRYGDSPDLNRLPERYGFLLGSGLYTATGPFTFEMSWKLLQFVLGVDDGVGPFTPKKMCEQLIDSVMRGSQNGSSSAPRPLITSWEMRRDDYEKWLAYNPSAAQAEALAMVQQALGLGSRQGAGVSHGQLPADGVS